MKKIVISLFIAIVMVIFCEKIVYANDEIKINSQIVNIKQKNVDEIEKYKIQYGNEAFGMVAYILDKVRLYIIPLCFIGFCIVKIYEIIGIRDALLLERARALRVMFVSIFLICQILPLVFAIVIKLNIT